MNSLPIAHRAVWKRDGKCPANQHSCLDTGHGDQCCENDSYCFVDTKGLSNCCPLGSNCVGTSLCNSLSYFCTHTITITATALLPSVAAAAEAAEAAGPSSPLTNTNTTSLETGCCGRSCPQPRYYLCPPDLGGNCCPYGSECRADGNCVGALTPTTTTGKTPGTTTATKPTRSPTVTCPTSVCGGGGGNGTVVGDGGGLSTATKTGIAVTVVAGVGVVAGLVAWLWVVRRRYRARAAAASASASAASASGWAGESRGEVSEAPGNEVAAVELYSPVRGNDDDEEAGDGAGGAAQGQRPMTEIFELDGTEVGGLRLIAEEERLNNTIRREEASRRSSTDVRGGQ